MSIQSTIADWIWSYVNRTLASGSPDEPTTPQGWIAKGIWEYANRTLRTSTANHLVIYHKQDGDATDASGNGRDGTPTDVLWTPGKIGLAASFNGTTSLISVANPGSVLDGKLLTVCAWVYRNGTSGTGYPRVIDRVYNGQFACYLTDSENIMGMAVKGVGGSIDTGLADATVPVNTLTHCAWVYDGTQIRAYVNGVLKKTLSANYGVLAASTSAICIGDRADGTNRKWKGWIDDLRVYDEVLPAWKIKAIHNDRRGRYSPWEPKIVRPLIRRVA